MSDPAAQSAPADAADTGDTPTVRRWNAPSLGAGANPERGPGLLTAEGLAQIEEQAREEGYRRGMEEGRQAGERAGEKEVRKVAQRLEAVVRALHPCAGVLDDALMQQLEDLVIAVSRQFVRRELAREPGEVVRVVREALAVLPVSDAEIRLQLHPDDAKLVRDALPVDAMERRLRVIEDVTLTRGGARVHTDVSSVDATVERRLNAVAARLFGDERTAGGEADDAGTAGAGAAVHADPNGTSGAAEPVDAPAPEANRADGDDGHG